MLKMPFRDRYAGLYPRGLLYLIRGLHSLGKQPVIHPERVGAKGLAFLKEEVYLFALFQTFFFMVGKLLDAAVFSK
jgi:hypothetical protein